MVGKKNPDDLIVAIKIAESGIMAILLRLEQDHGVNVTAVEVSCESYVKFATSIQLSQAKSLGDV